MLATIAWRNIWRNPRRSWVLMTAIAVGVFSFLGATTFMDGFSRAMIETAVDVQGGHVQILADGYHDNPTIRGFVRDPAAVEAVLAAHGVAASAPFVAAQGMANSAERAAGVMIQGVDPSREPRVTALARAVVEGRYLDPGGDPNDIVVGAALADRLNVRLGEKIVLMLSDLDNEVSAAAFRIAGLFRTSSTDFDKTAVFIPLEKAQELLGYGEEVTGYALRLGDEAEADALAPALEADLPRRLDALTWKERFPMLELAMESYDYSVVVLVLILFTAVAFTIINSFLMVIFERIREIGIMMANGVRPREVRRMLYLEAVFMVGIGIGVGLAVSSLVVGYFYYAGLDLSAFAAGLGDFGIATVVYPHLDWSHIVVGFVLIVAMVLLAVLYPAYKASRFEIVDAINYV